jgi:shikimate kinase
LITGMSATGKSSVIRQLIALGHRAVDLDTPEWSRLVPDDSGYADPEVASPVDWRWREHEVSALLATAEQDTLFVAGTSTGQSRFSSLLDHVVVLTIPAAVARERLAHRATNDYGKDATELRRELRLREIVDPLLRRSACLEVDTSAHPLLDVVEIITSHARRPDHRVCRTAR